MDSTHVSLGQDLHNHPALTWIGIAIAVAFGGWMIYRWAGGRWPNLK